MKMLSQILIEPYFTEKTAASMLNEKASAMCYAFKVAPSATKGEIRAAVEQRFDVEVDSVNTVIVRGKKRRVRYQIGKRANWKKAIITLKPGMKIAEFEGA